MSNDVGHGNALLSPLSTVHVTGSARGLTVTFHPPLPAAGAEPAVADPTDAVAAGSAVLDTDGSSTDRDRVQHFPQVTTHTEPDSLRRQRGTAPTVTVPAREEGQEHGPRDRQSQRDGVNADDPEAVRQARLRRWQAIG